MKKLLLFIAIIVSLTSCTQEKSKQIPETPETPGTPDGNTFTMEGKWKMIDRTSTEQYDPDPEDIITVDKDMNCIYSNRAVVTTTLIFIEPHKTANGDPAFVVKITALNDSGSLIGSGFDKYVHVKGKIYRSKSLQNTEAAAKLLAIDVTKNPFLEKME